MDENFCLVRSVWSCVCAGVGGHVTHQFSGGFERVEP